MQGIAADLRHAFRLIRIRPGFTAVAVTILALGIGANTALFSVVDGVLLRPLPFPEGNRLCWLSEYSQRDGSESLTSFDNFADLRRDVASFERLTAYAFDNFNLTGGQSPQQLRAARVAEGFFGALGVRPLLGRTFEPDENGPRPARVAVLTERLWKSQFGADPGTLGREIELDGRPWTVVGVMPASFDFPVGWDIWVPLGDPRGEEPRDNKRLWVLGRLRPGVSLKRAQEEMDSVATRLADQYPGANKDWGIRLLSFKERLVGKIRPTILLLVAAVATVLLIACANVSSLLLAKSRGREREISIRLALGAGARRIVRQLLIESLLLAGLGGAFGWLAALWSLDALLSLAPARLPRLEAIQMNWRVFLFSIAAAAVSGALAGLLPALQAGKSDLASSLKEGASVSGGGRNRGRHLLVVGQMALAVALLSGAALIARSLWVVSSQDPGFSRNVLTMGLVLPPNEYPEGAQRVAFFEEATAKLKALPGAADAGAANFLPTFGQTLQVKVRTSESAEPLRLEQRVVTSGFFSTLGMPLMAGRDFAAVDRAGSVAVAILNQAAANLLWPGEAPLGKELRMLGRNGPTKLRVVGLVGNVRVGSLTDTPVAEIYLPYAQNPWGYMNLVVRARRGDALRLLPAARQTLWDIDPRRPFFSESTLGDVLDRTSLAEPRFRTVFLGFLAVSAAVMAIMGLYSLIAYMVNGRRREIATRMALGARPGQILRLMMREGLALATIGVAIGLAVTLLGGRLLAGMLYQVAAHDPLILATVVSGLSLAAIGATAIPAMRAARTEPARVLRRG